MQSKRTLIILNNIGTPQSPEVKDVRKYLREFLMDPKVIQIPFLFRFILVYGIISFFRAPHSAVKYRSIWTPAGSPLLIYTLSFAKKLRELISSEGTTVEIAMRYQQPSIESVLNSQLNGQKWDEIIFAPLYPQWAESTTLSAVEKFKKELFFYKKNQSLQIRILKPFWNHPLFIKTWVDKISRKDLSQYQAILFSYHGLPESQLKKNEFCKFNENACCSLSVNCEKNCYRAQCFHTTKLISESLSDKIKHLTIITSFQSRLGRSKWIEPYTDKTLIKLAASPETRKILVVCPAFAADCLETLEEINMENRKLFLQAGGVSFDYLESLNDNSDWVKNFSQLLQEPKLLEKIEPRP
ncbi:MAG: ferrochelatase [Bdellovibrionaceae bacterium]|nr:ferrochelatase [Pseudobdellovibrionaceae bacterium]NUM58736.1 ferrochelatase [Pseudobdellovibrionaceae bacterium]